MRSATSYDLVEIANSYLTTVAANKIVMALPWYGREWPTVTADLNSRVQTDQALYGRAHNIDYADALTYSRQYGRSLDLTEMTAWTALRGRSCSSCPETWVQVYYDDVDTLNYKFDWVASKGMAGIGIFALGYDGQQPEFWKLLRVPFWSRGALSSLTRRRCRSSSAKPADAR
jgi:spore germination protein YaaH